MPNIGTYEEAYETQMRDDVEMEYGKSAMSNDINPIESMSVLLEASNIVNGARQSVYGSPERNYDQIAKFWSVYLDKEITGIDVCQMMILLKQVRLAKTPTHRDSLVDIAGYAALIEIINTPLMAKVEMED